MVDYRCVQGDIYDFGSDNFDVRLRFLFYDIRLFSHTMKAQYVDSLPSGGSAESDTSCQNKSAPVIIRTETGHDQDTTKAPAPSPVKQGVPVVTKHLRKRKSDKRGDPGEGLRLERARENVDVQRFNISPRPLFHGRTWLQVRPGEISALPRVSIQ